MFGVVVRSFPNYCFIRPNGVIGQDHFGSLNELVEYASIPPVGERVEFDSCRGERGLYAAKIRPVVFDSGENDSESI